MAEENQTGAGTVAGTVALLGRPNVGKSTLLNRIVGEKLAIVTPKPQTTRNRITGVYNGERGQIVFVDTPGVHGAKKGLNRFMVGEAMGMIQEVDAALVVIDVEVAMQVGGGKGGVGDPEGTILRQLAEAGRPTVLAVNKVDTLKAKTLLLPVLERLGQNELLRAIVPVSATKGTNVDGLIGELWSLLPAGPPLYAPDMLTDRSERFLASELIREQLFLSLRQEIPYAVAVVIEEWEEREGKGDVVISASIVVEREGQRAVILGHKGAMIRELGTRARGAISELLQRPAHLKLHVDVDPDWTVSPDALERYGYRSS
jgi:GTP-binding protein Era